MAYVVSGTLMVVPSFGRMPADQVHDLSRLYPYHEQRKSARPVDAFRTEYPRVYDFRIDAGWHQLSLFNFDTANEATVGTDLAADLGLDPNKQYYIYDFWNDALAGKVSGANRFEQRLRAGEARMLSVHEAVSHPQFLSTNRHLMQGYVDLLGCTWDPARRQLSGVSTVAGGETYKVIVATNGFTPTVAAADERIERSIATSRLGAGGGKAALRVRMLPGTAGLAEVAIDRADSGPVAWSVTFEANP
jgi:hypothetical protein